jgi:hypothetical protein
VIRRRARCSSKACGKRWTVYEGDAYPHRVFGLDVLVSAVLLVVVAGATRTASAASHLCSRRSVQRWIAWIGALAEPRDLDRLCTRIAAEHVPISDRSTDPTKRILALMERLAGILIVRGVLLSSATSGLARILTDRLVRFGEVYRLTKRCPPLRGDLVGIRA